MCSTMPGICKHGICNTRPCSNDIYCDCHSGYEGVYCDSPITTAGQNSNTKGGSSEADKTHVSGNVDNYKVNSQATESGQESSLNNKSSGNGTPPDNNNGKGNGIDNGPANNNGGYKIDNGPKDNGANNNGINSKLQTTTETSTSTIASTKVTTVSNTAFHTSAKASIETTTQIIETSSTSTSQTTADTGRPESVGEQINKKLQNGEIKVENVLDVLIASVNNEAHVTSEQPTKDASTSVPSTAGSTPSFTEQSTTTIAKQPTPSTIHPDGSYIKGPESTYLSDNSPLSLESSNQTVEETANNQSVKNTTETVTIPFTVLTLAGIVATPRQGCNNNCQTKKSGAAMTESSVQDKGSKSETNNPKQHTSGHMKETTKQKNEEKLVKIVESIIIHKPAPSVISKSHGTVNIKSAPIDKSASKTNEKTSENNPETVTAGGANNLSAETKLNGTDINKTVTDPESSSTSTASSAVQTTTI